MFAKRLCYFLARLCSYVLSRSVQVKHLCIAEVRKNRGGSQNPSESVTRRLALEVGCP